MKISKKQSKEILTVVEIARKYVEAGYKVGKAISMAQRDIREDEIEKYEQ